jgi:hypothetical protein
VAGDEGGVLSVNAHSVGFFLFPNARWPECLSP